MTIERTVTEFGESGRLATSWRTGVGRAQALVTAGHAGDTSIHASTTSVSSTHAFIRPPSSFRLFPFRCLSFFLLSFLSLRPRLLRLFKGTNKKFHLLGFTVIRKSVPLFENFSQLICYHSLLKFSFSYGSEWSNCHVNLNIPKVYTPVKTPFKHSRSIRYICNCYSDSCRRNYDGSGRLARGVAS